MHDAKALHAQLRVEAATLVELPSKGVGDAAAVVPSLVKAYQGEKFSDYIRKIDEGKGVVLEYLIDPATPDSAILQVLSELAKVRKQQPDFAFRIQLIHLTRAEFDGYRGRSTHRHVVNKPNKNGKPPYRAQVTIEFGAISVSGRLKPEQIKATLVAGLNKFDKCYRDALADDPKVAGTEVLNFTVGMDGRVSGLRLAGPVPCLGFQLYDLTFDKPESGLVTISVPVKLSTP